MCTINIYWISFFLFLSSFSSVLLIIWVQSGLSVTQYYICIVCSSPLVFFSHVMVLPFSSQYEMARLWKIVLTFKTLKQVQREDKWHTFHQSVTNWKCFSIKCFSYGCAAACFVFLTAWINNVCFWLFHAATLLQFHWLLLDVYHCGVALEDKLHRSLFVLSFTFLFIQYIFLPNIGGKWLQINA